MPVVELSADDFSDDKIDIGSLLVKAGLVASKSEARRNIEQGGVSVDGDKISDVKKSYTMSEMKQGIVIKRGKKSYKKVVYNA